MSKDITTKLIKELRDATGISVMQCKNALEEAAGDMEKALAILKKTSADIALKKAGREALLLSKREIKNPFWSLSIARLILYPEMKIL